MVQGDEERERAQVNGLLACVNGKRCLDSTALDEEAAVSFTASRVSILGDFCWLSFCLIGLDPGYKE